MEKDLQIRKLIDNWKNSANFAEFQLKKKEKRTQALNINTKIMNEDNKIDEEEFIEMLHVLIDVYSSSSTEDENIDDMLQSIGTKEEILCDHEMKLSVWHIYMYLYIKEEKYEVAELIKKVIVLEKKEFFSIIKSFRYDLYTDEDFIEKIQTSYVTYIELLNEKLGYND